MPFLTVSFLVGRVALLKETEKSRYQLILTALLEDLVCLQLVALQVSLVDFAKGC